MDKYGVIAADPPWEYKVWSEKGTGRSASQHYNVMETESIGKRFRPMIDELADKDCALFLWATYPNIVDAFDVMYEWGFEFKTVAFTWVKLTKISHVTPPVLSLRVVQGMYANKLTYEGGPVAFYDDVDETEVWDSIDLRFHMGNGMWTRANPEIVLLGTRGHPRRTENRGVRNLLLSPRGAHSEKPDEMYRRVELLVADQRRIELFARKQREGWDVWGDQV